VPVLPADTDADGLFLEDLLDHPRPALLRRPFRLNDDRVSDVSPHRASSVRTHYYREQASAPQIRTLLRALEDSTRPTRTPEAENGTLETVPQSAALPRRLVALARLK
jgi:hypothetical protein